MKFISTATNFRVRPTRIRHALLAVLMGIFGYAGHAGAHHSFAMFDSTKKVSIEGTVKDFQWTNPHVWLELIATTPDGPRHYSIEGLNPNILRLTGWAFNSLKPGDKVTVVINPLRSGESGGSLVSVTFPDGRTLGGNTH
jgi:hypothetical protein